MEGDSAEESGTRVSVDDSGVLGPLDEVSPPSSGLDREKIVD